MNKPVNLNDILDKLLAVAKQDGIFEEDEKALIKTFINDAKKYTQLLDEALKDGVIDKGEKSRLLQLRLNIANKAKKLAQEDLIITPEEKQLMLEFHKILLDLESRHGQ